MASATDPGLLRALQDLVARAVATKRITTSVTSTYTMTSADGVVRADATAAAFTVTLPAASDVTGEVLRIIKVDVSAHAVTVATQGTDTIGSGALVTISLPAADSFVTLRAYRTNNTVNFDRF